MFKDSQNKECSVEDLPALHQRIMHYLWWGTVPRHISPVIVNTLHHEQSNYCINIIKQVTLKTGSVSSPYNMSHGQYEPWIDALASPFFQSKKICLQCPSKIWVLREFYVPMFVLKSWNEQEGRSTLYGYSKYALADFSNTPSLA